MSSRALSLSELDGLIELVGLPVRTHTLEEAWTEATTPARIAAPDEQFLLLLCMRAMPERESQFEEAIVDVAAFTYPRPGTAPSTLPLSSPYPLHRHPLPPFPLPHPLP